MSGLLVGLFCYGLGILLLWIPASAFAPVYTEAKGFAGMTEFVVLGSQLRQRSCHGLVPVALRSFSKVLSLFRDVMRQPKYPLGYLGVAEEPIENV